MSASLNSPGSFASGTTITYYYYHQLNNPYGTTLDYWQTAYYGTYYSNEWVTLTLMGTITISLSQVSGTPSFASAITVSTTGSYGTGSWSITVTGTGGGDTHSCYYTLSV
jgi:hypothetical protein